MPRDYKNIKNNKSEPKIKNTSNLFSFLIGLVLGTFATSIYFNQNENIYEGKPSFNDNNYNKENENIVDNRTYSNISNQAQLEQLSWSR